MIKEIFLDNKFDFIWSGVRPNPLTGLDEPASGLLGLTARISATKGGPAIHAVLAKNLAERAETPGEYFAVVDGDDLREQLETDYIGAIVWIVFGDGGEGVLYNTKRRVVATRQP